MTDHPTARPSGALTRARAEALDAADPLAEFRDRFVIDDPSLIYMDGNSLGRLPIATGRPARAASSERSGVAAHPVVERAWLDVARTGRRSTRRRTPRRRGRVRSW